MSAKDSAVVIGGEPRIDFLPPEIRQKKAGRRTVRSLALLTIAVLVLGIAAYAGVTTLAIASQVALSAEQERTTELLREQSTYSEARLVAETVAAAEDARIVASAHEIMWREYFEAAIATVPGDASITSWIVDSYPVGEEPPVIDEGLEVPRYATVTMNARFTSVTAIADWIDRLKEIPGVSGFVFNGAEASIEAGGYETTAGFYLDETAFERRYFQQPVDDAVSDEDAVDETSEGDE